MQNVISIPDKKSSYLLIAIIRYNVCRTYICPINLIELNKMQNIINNQYITAVFITRILGDFVVFFHGYDAIVRVGIKNVIETLHLHFQKKEFQKGIQSSVYE